MGEEATIGISLAENLALTRAGDLKVLREDVSLADLSRELEAASITD